MKVEWLLGLLEENPFLSTTPLRFGYDVPNPYRVLREEEKPEGKCQCAGNLPTPSYNKLPSHIVPLWDLGTVSGGVRHAFFDTP